MFQWIKSVFSGGEEKLNPAQPSIAKGNESNSSGEPIGTYKFYYSKLEIVQRGVNMLVDDTSAIPFRVGNKLDGVRPVQSRRKKDVEKLLNYQPNFFQDAATFRANMIMDYIMDGNIFLYFDGVHLYHLPANKMVIKSSPTTYVEKYVYDGETNYTPDEIIHIKENSVDDYYRGKSRMASCLNSMVRLSNMKSFQDNFFKNGAVPGLIIKSPDILGEKIKDRLLASWMDKYNPTNGGKRPLILDGGMDIDRINNTNFKELDFATSVMDDEKRILRALGVPPPLIMSEVNDSSRPNMRLYYLETVIPITRKICKALERFFGYEIAEDTIGITAMQPELQELAAYYSTLTNGGILSANESRIDLGRETIDGHDDLRIPANIAGSASNPSEGGRPKDPQDK